MYVVKEFVYNSENLHIKTKNLDLRPYDEDLENNLDHKKKTHENIPTKFFKGSTKKKKKTDFQKKKVLVPIKKKKNTMSLRIMTT